MILRKRYYTECPIEEQPDDELNLLVDPQILKSPGSRSGISEYDLPPPAAAVPQPYDPVPLSPERPMSNPSAAGSPFREPPPYKPPPQVMHHAYMNQQKYGDCVDEYKSALRAIGRAAAGLPDDPDGPENAALGAFEEPPPEIVIKSKPSKDDSNLTMQLKRQEQVQEPTPATDGEDKENAMKAAPVNLNVERTKTLDKQISVKEATRKFNRIASEEEAAKVTSPPAKKKPEKVSLQYSSVSPRFAFQISDFAFFAFCISSFPLNAD